MAGIDFLQKGLGIVSPSHFVNDFSRKMFLILYSINWPSLIVWLAFLLEMFGNACIAIVCFPCCDVIILKLILSFYQFVFLHDQKIKTNSEITLERKKLFRWIKKHFSLMLNCYQWAKMHLKSLPCHPCGWSEWAKRGQNSNLFSNTLLHFYEIWFKIVTQYNAVHYISFSRVAHNIESWGQNSMLGSRSIVRQSRVEQ